MILFLNPGTDPGRNLAMEEYWLRERSEAFFMLWRNRPCVIVGKNQNPYAQIHPACIRQHGIPVLRRISGGGAVYHDLGNVNFSWIRTIGHPGRMGYQALLEIVMDFLKDLGVAVQLAGRSDLMVDGRKISGNALHYSRGRLLHHGTLLFDTDLNSLSRALTTGPGEYQDISVASIRKQVTNLRPLLASDLTVETFMRRFLAHWQLRWPTALQTAPTLADQARIDALAQHRYGSWDWHFGHTPNYRFHNTLNTPAGPWAVQISVQRGRIQDFHLAGPGVTATQAMDLRAVLIGQRHAHEDVLAVIAGAVSDWGPDRELAEWLADGMF